MLIKTCKKFCLMQKLDMVIKCNLDNSFYNYSFAPAKTKEPSFMGVRKMALKSAERNADKFVKGPVASESATGLLNSASSLYKNTVKKFKTRVDNYKRNIAHTYEHKVVFSIVERELFGKNSIDSITHDLDKLILYALGFSKSFVGDFHRKHSEHHIESGKKMNLRSMICDNIASSPEFKPEKKYHLREYYEMTPELQQVSDFGTVLERYNYGEGLDFDKINREKEKRTKNIRNFTRSSAKVLASITLLPFKII